MRRGYGDDDNRRVGLNDKSRGCHDSEEDEESKKEGVVGKGDERATDTDTDD